MISAANPLRSIASDSAYVASVIQEVNGPIVLVGHSHGGAAISPVANAVPNVKALFLATAQRPVTQAALEEKATTAAWKRLPSWYLVGTKDEAIVPAAQRFIAKRAKAYTVEVAASHASYLSHPTEVANLILRAARSIGR